MKGDTTRTTFNRAKHFSSVRQQQGRVQLDADWNEAFDIMAYRDRTTRIDVIGTCGGPIHQAGYEIQEAAGQKDLHVGAGRYYVAGILCENDQGQLITAQITLPGFHLPEKPGNYLAYLDVWERHLTALEEPDIREVALGGPDTATRLQVTPQVKLEPVDNKAKCSDFYSGWVPAEALSTGQLAAQAEPGDDPTEPCEVPAKAGYRRLENQLYRVEIHRSGLEGVATYKWSRENGSVLFAIDDQDGSDKLILAGRPRDQNLGLATGNWVELSDDDRELQGKPGILVKVLKAEDEVVTIDTTTIDDPENPGVTTIDLDTFGPNPKMRRWESEGDLTVTAGTWLDLEDGVQVQFRKHNDHRHFQTGDYWQIPARTIGADVLWPDDESTNAPEFQSRHGIHHYYCPLALVHFDGKEWHFLTDCRRLFPPLTELPSGGENCCTVTVGDGSISVGDFEDIQEAVDAIEGSGRVCILPGVYPLRKPVIIDGLQITISGCGRQSLIIAPGNDPAFVARGSEARFLALTVDAATPQGAISLTGCKNSAVLECHIRNLGQESAVETVITPRLRASSTDKLRRARRVDAAAAGKLKALLLQGAGPAVLALDVDNLALCNNLLIGRPAATLQAIGLVVSDNQITGGGTWVMDGSTAVEIDGNEIFFGDGPGIILGGARAKDELRADEAGVEQVHISHNQIYLMAHNGIASATEMDGVAGLGDVDDVTIVHNRIEGNAWAPEATDSKNSFDNDDEVVGGIVLANTSRLRVHDNQILYNGGNGLRACGLFVEMCEELAVTGNFIQENGQGQDQVDCIDFRPMEPTKGEAPLQIQGVTFLIIGVDGSELPGWNIDATEDGSALNGRNGIRMKLPEPVPVASLTYANNGTSGKVTALNADGSESSADLPHNSEPQTTTLNGSGIVELFVEALQNEFFLLELCLGEKAQQARGGYQAGIVALFISSGDVTLPSKEEPTAAYTAGGPALLAHGNVVVCPAGPALLAAGAGPMLIGDNSFTSRGPADQPLKLPGADNVFLRLALMARCVAVINMGISAEQLSAAGGAAGMTLHATPAVAAASQLLSLPHGHLAFHGNQVTQEIANAELALAPPTIGLVSLDDVAIHDNQVRTSLANAIQLVDLLTFGLTVRVSDNRISEFLNTTLASCLSIGLLNNTSDNLSTHCIFAAGTTVVRRDNQVINQALCKRGEAVLAEG